MVASVQSVLAEAIEGQSNWRAQKAEEYPGDVRNARAAEGLLALANYVRGLPETDQRIRDLARLTFVPGGDVAVFGQNASHELSRFRFDTPDEDCDGFLTHLVGVVWEDVQEMLMLSGAPDEAQS